MDSLESPSTDRGMNFSQEHLTHRALSRRQFIGGAVRATAIGAVASSGFLSAPIALADDTTGSSVMPRPIPGGFLTPFGVISHHFRPARGIEASTITDFNGFIGLAEIEGGRGVGTNTLTGAETPMFFGMDNRFMIGEFVGVDGEVHRGAFGFIWMDLFTVNQDGSQGPQVHDFNPGIPTSGPSAGLFWTAHVPMDSIEIDLGRATASMQLTNFATKDFFTLKNAFLNAIVPQPAGTIPPVDATITLLHRWSGVKARVNVTDFESTDLTTNRRFAGRFIEDTATVEWSATVPSKNFQFKSGPADPSKSSFAEIGRERNGVFFRPGEEG